MSSKVVGEALNSVKTELAGLLAQRSLIDERITDLRAMSLVLGNIGTKEDADAKEAAQLEADRKEAWPKVKGEVEQFLDDAS